LAFLHHVRTRRRILTRAAAVLLALSSGACGGGARDSATADTAVLRSAGGDSATRAPSVDTAAATAMSPMDPATTAAAGPAFVTRVDSAAGDTLFRAVACQSCHGARGEGVTGLGPSLADGDWLHGNGSAAFIEQVIVTGVAEPKTTLRGMPAFASRLAPAQAARVASYVVSLSRPDLVVDALPSDAPPGAAADTLPPP
jgi:mono/diheme cytochrome c family protein